MTPALVFDNRIPAIRAAIQEADDLLSTAMDDDVVWLTPMTLTLLVAAATAYVEQAHEG